MFIYAETVRTEKYKPKQIYWAIIIGFTGQLRGWLEWTIGEKGQQEILNGVKS